MPYAVKKRGNKYAVVVHPGTAGERTLATHDTEESAVKQVQAIYANEMKKRNKK